MDELELGIRNETYSSFVASGHAPEPAHVAAALDLEEHEDGLLVAITEQRTREDIDRLADVLGAAVAAERQHVGAAR